MAKTLKFRRGDRIKSDTREYTVYEICDGYYRLFDDECGAVSMHLLFKDEDKFELVGHKKKVKVSALMFTKQQADEISRHVDKMTERETEIFENAYNMGLKYGWKMGVVMLAFTIFAMVAIVAIVYR